MSLDERRNDFESRYAHDQELRFKVVARRNKLVGLWAAGELGKSGAEADSYAQDTVMASFAKPGDEGVIEKVRRDFDAAGIAHADDRIRRQLAQALGEAEAQLAKE